MKQVIKYAALIFALILAASIIGGCLTAGVAIAREIMDRTSVDDNYSDGSNGIWYRDEEGDVVFMGIHFGGRDDAKSGSESFIGSEISSLYVESSMGELIIDTWAQDQILVEYENIPETYEIYSNNGTLVIEKEDGIFFWNSFFSNDTKIHITVPENRVFGGVKVDKGSGSGKLTGFSADTLTVESGSGSMTISEVTAQKTVLDSGSGAFNVRNSSLGEASMDSGSGFVNFENITAGNLVLDSGSGRVDVSGVLTGNCVFDTGSGSVDVEIYGREEDYNVRADMGSGSFYFNGKKIDDIRTDNRDAKHLLVFEAGSGRVSVEFK